MGSLKIPGKTFGCSDRFPSCSAFFKHQEDCEKQFTKRDLITGEH